MSKIHTTSPAERAVRSTILSTLFAGQATKGLLEQFRGVTPETTLGPVRVLFLALVLERAHQQGWTLAQIVSYGPTERVVALLGSPRTVATAFAALRNTVLPGIPAHLMTAARELAEAYDLRPLPHTVAAAPAPVVEPAPEPEVDVHAPNARATTFTCLAQNPLTGKTFQSRAEVIAVETGPRGGERVRVRVTMPNGTLRGEFTISGKQYTRLVSERGGSAGTDEGIRLLTGARAMEAAKARREVIAPVVAPEAKLQAPAMDMRKLSAPAPQPVVRSSLDAFRALQSA